MKMDDSERLSRRLRALCVKVVEAELDTIASPGRTARLRFVENVLDVCDQLEELEDEGDPIVDMLARQWLAEIDR
jgi:hypothetical protein